MKDSGADVATLTSMSAPERYQLRVRALHRVRGQATTDLGDGMQFMAWCSRIAIMPSVLPMLIARH